MKIKDHIYLYAKGAIGIISKCGMHNFIVFLYNYFIINNTIKEKIKVVIYEHKIANPGIHYQKYLDINYWLFENMCRFYSLGLYKNKNKLKILDIGTGTGYFPFVCKFYGHEAEALDIPGNDMYNEIIKKLGIKRYDIYIQSYRDIEIKNKYDLVTAFMICFNNHKKQNLWNIQEWEYFLNSVYINNLNPGGEIYLTFNSESVEEPVSKELLEYFSSNDASIHGNMVHIKSEKFFTRYRNQ